MKNLKYSLLALIVATVTIPLPTARGETDMTDPAAVAKAVLTAYKAKDLVALAELSNSNNQEFIASIAKIGEAHPRYASIFKGWRWDAVEGWDGNLHGTRYRSAGEAAVHFADMEGDEIAVVVLTLEDGKWLFEDVNSPSKASYERGDEERPE